MSSKIVGLFLAGLWFISSSATYAQNLTVGNFHALIIGNSHYKGESGVWHDLNTPGENAETLSDILKKKYRFEEVSLLRDASKTEMLYALEELSSQVQKHDSVLIYYAGHAKRKGSTVYWIPTDAAGNRTSSYIDTDKVRDLIDNLSESTNHILLISDAPFDTSLIDANQEPHLKFSVNKKFLPQLSKHKSVQAIVLASSGFVDVDYRNSGQTPLSYHMTEILKETNANILTFEELANRIYHKLDQSQQKNLRYGVIKGTKDDTGEYMFVRSRETSQSPEVITEKEEPRTTSDAVIVNTRILLPFIRF